VGDLKLQVTQAEQLLDILTCNQRGVSPIAALAPYSGKNEMLDAGMEELFTVARYMENFGVPDTHFTVDLTLARGLDYYTGTVYETIIPDQPEIGSICGGGRYDNLAENYTDKKLPGVGVSIGLTRLFYVLDEQNYLNEDMLTAPADVLILPMTEDWGSAISFATAVRGMGIRAQIYGEDKKFKAKMGYANKLNIPYVVFLGEDEIAAGKVTVKDMITGEQETISPRLAAEAIAIGVAAGRGAKPIKKPE
jgi:histidyl-tRNA synthetase